MALLAESASGFLVGMNVPDDKLPLIKTMKIDYLKRAQGDLTAIATLEAGQIEQIRQQDKGEVRVAVLVSDENGNQPIACEMVWAWVGKKPRVATAAQVAHLRSDYIYAAKRTAANLAQRLRIRHEERARPGGAAAGLPWCGRRKTAMRPARRIFPV